MPPCLYFVGPLTNALPILHQHQLLDASGRPQPESAITRMFEERQGTLEIGDADAGASLAWWGIKESPFDAPPPPPPST